MEDISIPERNTDLYDNWVKWICGDFENDIPADQIFTNFITLTYSDKLHQNGVTDDIANQHFRYLVRILNAGVFGKRYIRIVGHSYFGYAVASEHTSNREVLHFHIMTTSSINYKYIHEFWGSKHGFAWIETINDQEKVTQYILKYLLKGRSEIQYYKPKKIFIPKYLPEWWV